MHFPQVHDETASPCPGTTQVQVHAGAITARRAHQRCPTALAHSAVALRPAVGVPLPTFRRRDKVETDAEAPQCRSVGASHPMRHPTLPQTSRVLSVVDQLRGVVIVELVLCERGSCPAGARAQQPGVHDANDQQGKVDVQ